MLGPAGVDALLWGYFTLAVAALLLFTRRWTTPAAYLALLILELVKILIIVQDYRLRLNQHYMAFFVALAFLLFPAKRRVVQYLIVLFYFWAQSRSTSDRSRGCRTLESGPDSPRQ